MKWEVALFNPKTAQDFKEDLECGDIIGLNTLFDFCLERQNYYQETNQTEGPYWRTLNKFFKLIIAATQLNPIIVEMEYDKQPMDLKYDDIYHEIMYSIHDYLIKIIEGEVK